MMTEKEYRSIKKNSSSSLKDFSVDRRKYYRKYILGEKIEEKENKASSMGKLVETLLMEEDRFDELFFMSSLEKVPGGMLGDFIFDLSLRTAKASELGTEPDFSELVEEAYKASNFKISLNAILKKLEDPNNELYYMECLKVNAKDMTMVTAQEINNAEKIVEELRNNFVTSTICTLETIPEKYTVINQMKIDDYIIDGMRLKSMLDKVIIDHRKKEVDIFDLKCTWSVEKFYKEYYLYRRSYIQGYLYYRAVQYLASLPDSEFYGYKVNPPAFIVCDSINYYKPLIYKMDESDLKDAYEGFTYKNTPYPGVKQIIEELQWAILEDEWQISKTNFEKGGILNIKE